MYKDIKLNNPPENELKKFIENVIENAYAGYQEKSTANVEVEFQKEIQIRFDSETPYLDKNFWKLLTEVSNQIEERLKQEGYVHKNTACISDFIIWYYSYEGKSED